jgi:hypothetical protein
LDLILQGSDSKNLKRIFWILHMKNLPKMQKIQKQKKLTVFQEDIVQLNRYHKLWLIFSIISSSIIILIFISWDFIIGKNSNLLKWSIISLEISLSIIWWLWTINLVKKMLRYQHSILDILLDITNGINEIKTEVLDLKIKD